MRLAHGFALVCLSVSGASADVSVGNTVNWVRDLQEAARLDQLARYPEAEIIYNRILPILKDTSVLPENDFMRAEFSNDLGVHYFRLARYGEAEQLYRDAIAIWRQLAGAAARNDLALALGNLAALNRARARFVDAEPLYREELHILEQVSGKHTANYVVALNNLAELRRAEGDLPGA